MTRKIYDQHNAAFQHVSAYVLMKDGERIATIAFKYPKDGAGRLWCYFHYIGAEMTRGYAGGYGYDKTSAAVCAAIDAIKPYKHGIVFNENDTENTRAYWASHESAVNAQLDKIRAMFKDIGGKDWSDVLRDNNIQVLQAV